mmetsp:Transcript_95652/g.309858  ORF Transcript_95652/g.309858 Transcript_95652/m.309858 type:complete len:211 (-) Transcript_95652:182-814(-)
MAKQRVPLLVLAAAALLGLATVRGLEGQLFVTGPRSAPRRSVSRTSPLFAGQSAAAEGYEYVPVKWAIDMGISDDSLRQVMERVNNIDSIWPTGRGSLDREDFRSRVKAGQSSLDDRAIDTVFNTFNAGTYLATDREGLAKTIAQWRASGGAPSASSLGGGIAGAKVSVIGAWLFLNVFSAFAAYFIILRPILDTNFGIDLLPGQPKYWE